VKQSQLSFQAALSTAHYKMSGSTYRGVDAYAFLLSNARRRRRIVEQCRINNLLIVSHSGNGLVRV